MSRRRMITATTHPAEELLVDAGCVVITVSAIVDSII
jgi:hypothetical protein